MPPKKRTSSTISSSSGTMLKFLKKTEHNNQNQIPLHRKSFHLDQPVINVQVVMCVSLPIQCLEEILLNPLQ